MNILLTSVGRRGYVVEYFKKEFFSERKIFTSNSDLTHAMKMSDGYLLTPLIYEEHYIDTIIKYCKDNNISVVISLFDIDLLVLSKNEDRFKANNIELILAPHNSVEICNDKWKTYLFLKDLNIKTPKTYLSIGDVINAVDNKELSYPVILKPRWGMASMGIYIADDENELKVLYKKSHKDIFNSYLKYESSMTQDDPILIQELLLGNEYGLDVVNNLQGDYITCLAKQKLVMRAGETFLGLTVNNEIFSDIAKILSKNIKHKGLLSVDAFNVNGCIYVTELNCRISGHYPISHSAGFNYPAVLKSWLKHVVPNQSDMAFEEGVTVSKELNIIRLN
ncbi:ATP-grasp domain-containing protein [Aeromonas caviae]|uniref:ATP-grasp domain-containing protein n=1 Tax=Aeromonas caviae TaxID=648 RepID=UPI0023AA64B4|nr:ATP-grasp domain-containing protein [Aeromonas caviae]WEE20402.1 ATP-grasp domain-containing protein [Aeromonas caviae]